MKTLRLLVLLLLAMGFYACEKETQNTPEIPVSQQMQGEWLVIYQKNKLNDFTFQDLSEGVVTEWGCFYIEKLKINSDGSFTINDSHKLPADNSGNGLGGYWEVQTQLDSITFSCQAADEHLHNITFKVYTDKTGYLNMENEQLHLKHLKKY